METKKKLLTEFAPVSRDIWKAKAIEDLKGADFDKKLVWRTDDDLSIQPFYTEEDLCGKTWLEDRQHSMSRNLQTWINYASVQTDDPAKANEQALYALRYGATGLLFECKHPELADFNAWLRDIDVTKYHVSFSTEQPSVHLVSEYLHYLDEHHIDTNLIKGFYACDVLEHWSVTGTKPNYNCLSEIIEMLSKIQGFKGLGIGSHSFLNAGSSNSQEIAFTLNKVTDYFEKLSQKGIKAQTIANSLLFHIAIGGDYFTEIAKLRALRLLATTVISQYEVSSNSIEILSSNSTWSKSCFDPNVNMLRNTTEAMSAVLGGCDALLTMPHDFNMQVPSRFSRRIALNVSNLLREESYLDKVVDPAAGSYYIENLTSELCNKALELFQQVEAEGGYTNSFTTGLIQSRIATVRRKRENEIALRRKVYVGTNKYPNALEKKVSRSTLPIAQEREGIDLLIPQHATRVFDELRNKTLAHYEKTGYLPSVYMACFGNLAMRKARATFAAEFFGTAGFDINGEYFFDDPIKAATESATCDSDIVVICSSDQEYEASAVKFAKTFREINKGKTLVLAGYPETIVAALKDAGVDTFIHIRANAIELLSDLQEKLFAKSLNTGVFY